MLVFTRDVATADATAAALRGVGPPVLRFHRDVPKASSRVLGALVPCSPQGTGIGLLLAADAGALGQRLLPPVLQGGGEGWGSPRGQFLCSASGVRCTLTLTSTASRAPSFPRRATLCCVRCAVPQTERATALERISGEEGLVLVCTDAAARGLDLPGITHVVQADFALSAIDFLHRVGGRLGSAGPGSGLCGLRFPASRPAPLPLLALPLCGPVPGALPQPPAPGLNWFHVGRAGQLLKRGEWRGVRRRLPLLGGAGRAWRNAKAAAGSGAEQDAAFIRAHAQVGRTARAGRSGRVTSFFAPENADLVKVIQAALEAGGRGLEARWLLL